jgi:hypothetical protein
MDFVHGDQADVVHEKHLEAGVSPNVNGASEKDLEAGVDSHEVDHGTEEEILARKLQQEKGFLRPLRRAEEWLDEKMGIETQGIDRIKEENKRPPSIINVFFLWWSLTCHVGTIPIGVLGPAFGLSLQQSAAAIVVGTMLGALCTSYTGTLGPKVRSAISCSSLWRLLEAILLMADRLVFVPLRLRDIRLVSMAPSSAPSST